MERPSFSSVAIKAPGTQYPVHDLIRSRWSARSFADRPIGSEELHTLFEAASWAASSMNEQPWMYYYAHRAEEENFGRFFGCLMKGNQLWAQNAAVLVLSVARRSFAGNGRPNRHYLHDTGSANTTLLLQAVSQGIYGHMMGGFEMDKTRETFGLTDDQEPACFIALGYLDDPERLEEPFRSRELTPRSRKGLEEFVFESRVASGE